MIKTITSSTKQSC